MYRERSAPWAVLLVPALLTTVAYVDPGNFGSNIEAGSVHGYDLLWVVALASVAAGIRRWFVAGSHAGRKLSGTPPSRMVGKIGTGGAPGGPPSGRPLFRSGITPEPIAI